MAGQESLQIVIRDPVLEYAAFKCYRCYATLNRLRCDQTPSLQLLATFLCLHLSNLNCNLFLPDTK